MGNKKLKNITAIDFGAFTLKVVNGTSEATQITLDKATKVPVPEGVYEDGQIRNADQIRDVLRPVVQENHLAGTRTVCTLESSLTVVRELVLPSVKQKELKEMIRYEIQNYLPIELNQYVIQSKLISESQEGGVKNATVMVAALPKEIAESHLSLLDEVGLRPMALDIHSNCQTKLLAGSQQLARAEFFKSKTIALMDIGHRQSNITIVEKGNFRFNRLMLFGGADIDLTLSNFMGISQAEARIMKTKLGDFSALYEDTSDEARAINVARNAVDTWLDEIERIFKFYTSRSSGNSIDAILLMGGSSHIKGLDRYLQKNIGIPTEIVAKIEGVKLPKSQGSLDLQQYVNALGAMIRF